ncbi:MAG TPA: site-2 protease family protein [bacterium]|nr:site-2 protease family protein [bacterium]
MFGLDPSTLPYVAVALLAAVTVHEYAHAYVADRLGDPTPRAAGRLTLNPLAHLDLVGTLLILLVGFGWAKPVPITPTNFRNWRRDTVIVAAAGPLANVTLLFVLGIPFKLGLLHAQAIEAGAISAVLLTTMRINAMLAIFNLIPIPPLDGSKILLGLLPPEQAVGFARVQMYGPFILLFLLMFTSAWRFLTVPMQWLVLQASGSVYF